MKTDEFNALPEEKRRAALDWKEAAPVAEPKRDFIADPLIGQALLDQALATIEETARQRDEIAALVETLRHRANRLEARLVEADEESARYRADAKEFRLLAMELTKQRDDLLAALELLLRQTGQEAILQARAAVRNAGGRVPAHAAMEQLERCQPAEKGDA